MTNEINKIIGNSTKILIVQADNPDGDSLGSALALETIFETMGKSTYLYCGVDMPGYLRYMPGWDRVSNFLPSDFDLTVIVDASTMTLLEKINESGKLASIASKPCIVLDHHQTVENEITFATVLLNDTKVSSTGELIFGLAKTNGWPLDKNSGRYIMSAILGDTQGLSNSLTTPQTYRFMAEITELGVDRSILEEDRREFSKMPPEIFSYKARLIDRTEFHIDGKLALVTIPHDEIMQYSPLYNPAPLIQTDMLQTSGVGVAAVLKHYNDGKVLGAIRCNSGYNIAADLAEYFGGGGHVYASGFKIHNAAEIQEVKRKCIEKTSELIKLINTKGESSETTQYAYTTD